MAAVATAVFAHLAIATDGHRKDDGLSNRRYIAERSNVRPKYHQRTASGVGSR